MWHQLLHRNETSRVLKICIRKYIREKGRKKIYFCLNIKEYIACRSVRLHLSLGGHTSVKTTFVAMDFCVSWPRNGKKYERVWYCNENVTIKRKLWMHPHLRCKWGTISMWAHLQSIIRFTENYARTVKNGLITFVCRWVYSMNCSCI